MLGLLGQATDKPKEVSRGLAVQVYVYIFLLEHKIVQEKSIEMG